MVFVLLSSFSIFPAVPRRETLSRLQDNEKFPLLGKQGRKGTRAGRRLLLLPVPPLPFFFPPFRSCATSSVAAGEQFIVKYNVSSCKETALGSLCLLCSRKLLKSELPAHVFSREHVLAFLVSLVVVPAFFHWPAVSSKTLSHCRGRLDERPTSSTRRVSFYAELSVPQIVVCTKVLRLTFRGLKIGSK